MSLGPVLLMPESGQRFPLDGEMGIGRADDNDIPVNGEGVSRFHATVSPSAAGYRVRDLGSRNGTFVNGEPVSVDGLLLSDGDLVVLAGSVAFRYLDPQATPLVPRIGKLQGVWIDPASADVWVDASKLDPPLSARQFDLLDCLVEAEGRPVSRADIVARVWPSAEPTGVSDDAVTALIKRLRSRLRSAGMDTDYLEIVRGRGVRLIDADD